MTASLTTVSNHQSLQFIQRGESRLIDGFPFVFKLNLLRSFSIHVCMVTFQGGACLHCGNSATMSRP